MTTLTRAANITIRTFALALAERKETAPIIRTAKCQRAAAYALAEAARYLAGALDFSARVDSHDSQAVRDLSWWWEEASSHLEEVTGYRKPVTQACQCEAWGWAHVADALSSDDAEEQKYHINMADRYFHRATMLWPMVRGVFQFTAYLVATGDEVGAAAAAREVNAAAIAAGQNAWAVMSAQKEHCDRWLYS